MIVGTSTGAILAVAIAMGKDLDKCATLYDAFGPEIFPQDLPQKKHWYDWKRWAEPTYRDTPLGDALQKLFALDTTLDKCKTNTLVTAYNVFTRNLFLLKSYDSETSDIMAWEACKASCSAPTYFPAHILDHRNARKPLVDGGIFANNPALLAIAEAIKLANKDSIKELHANNDEIVLLSLGTGSLQRPI